MQRSDVNSASKPQLGRPKKRWDGELHSLSGGYKWLTISGAADRNEKASDRHCTR